MASVDLGSAKMASARRLFVSEINSAQIRSWIPHRRDTDVGLSNFRSLSASGSPIQLQKGDREILFSMFQRKLWHVSAHIVRILCSAITMALARLEMNEPNFGDAASCFSTVQQDIHRGWNVTTWRGKQERGNAYVAVNGRIIKHRWSYISLREWSQLPI